jgi:hypothetical protein
MKKLIFIAIVFLFVVQVYAQVKTYSTSGSDLILSYAMLDDTLNPDVVPRFSCFLHINQHFHFDVAKHFGFFTGYGIRNIGFIAKYNDALNTTKKYRTYNFSVPFGFKFGTFEDKKPFFFFAGTAIDIPFHFKEKTFWDKEKVSKNNEWISERVNLLQPSAFIGITFPNKSSLKIQYFFNNFLNHNYSYTDDGTVYRPYGRFNATNIISINYGTYFIGNKK